MILIFGCHGLSFLVTCELSSVLPERASYLTVQMTANLMFYIPMFETYLSFWLWYKRIDRLEVSFDQEMEPQAVGDTWI